MKVLENMWRFTDTDKDISDSLAYKTLEYAENGDLKNFKKNYKELSKQYFGAEYLKMGGYRLLGWQFDFRPFLKRFLVREKYESVYRVYYALNRTNIYDNVYVSRNNIIDVIEDNR
jgi:hypothetical protein